VLPQTRYAKSGDLSIAYQVIGRGPIDLVYAPGWVSNVEYTWEEPTLSRALRRLASFTRLILFDKRGTGLSDRVPDGALPTHEERMDDVRAVMDAAGSERAALFGCSEGSSLCILFAARYPERTRALVVNGGFVKRLRAPDYPWAPTLEEREDAFAEVLREWGGPVGLATLAPSRAHDAEFARWWAAYLRRSASPKAAVTLLRMNTFIDLRHELPKVRAPTLVMHRTGDRDVSVEDGRYIAAHIAGARMLELPGDDHMWCVGGVDGVLDAIEEFVANVPRGAAGRDPHADIASALTLEAPAPTEPALPAEPPRALLHFEVLEKLGEGGMGAVFKARDTRLDRLVAIKRLARGIASDPDARRRFHAEARAASALHHPGIVVVHAIEEIGGVEHIVMEFVDGEPLDEIIARGPLPASRVVALGADIADALAHAHEAGLVHRDVKPANVIVAANGRPKVLDFGIAKPMAGAASPLAVSAPLTGTGAIVGTLPYMSPEQLAGAPVDGRADVFSLGCVLYEMATGVRAFDANDPVALVQRLVALDPAPPRTHVAGLPIELEAVVMRALEKRPAARFGSARELAGALRRIAGHDLPT
jgi:pimeloyl-ACP methyl ester carboxylesterase/tRNA A-37 threonylcarbamoyl transferase component Bud32